MIDEKIYNFNIHDYISIEEKYLEIKAILLDYINNYKEELYSLIVE